MKQLQKSDLIKGEIYTSKSNSDTNNLFIWMCSDNNKLNYSSRLYVSDINAKYAQLSLKNSSHSWSNIFESIPEEKHWLETCIIANEFISYEKAMKTFIPEYVECIESSTNGFTINKIYKVEEKSIISNKTFYLLDNGNIKRIVIMIGGLWSFKPSTKEAYDAQFVVKEPEFVLPEKWCIKFSHDKKLLDWCKENTQTKFTYFENLGVTNDNYFHYPLNTIQVITKDSNYSEITLEQFKKYVLKEDVKVLEEPKDKVLAHFIQSGKTTIQSVECSEGGIYRIGDKITPFDKDSPNKGKSFTITEFRWNNAKTEICAITDTHQPYGIRLSQIELYIEPKKEFSLLEQAKLRYPIGTKFKVACQPHVICTVLNHDTYYFQTSAICNLYVEERNYGVDGATVYYKGKWAEIVDDFVLPENWYIKVTDDNKEVLQQYIHNVHNSTTIALSNINYIAYSKWLYSINRTENKLGYGLISKLNLNPLPNTYRTVAYYNGVEITFEQFKKYVLK